MNDASPLRYGVLGTGNIAGQFTRDVAGAERSAVVAVGSRTAASAAAFGERFGIPSEHCHANYDALLADDSVEAVYVSLPNHLHREWSVRAMEAGKHVLCEKPLAMDAAEAEAMFDASRRTGMTLMEGFMYRTHPLTGAVLDAVRGGAIGELRMIRASFCYHTNKVGGNVRFAPEMGGGALMDIGCYGLSFARLFAGAEQDRAHLVSHRHAAGVDDYGCVALGFPNGVTAAVTFGMAVQLDNTAHLGGTEGYLEVPIPWKPPQRGATYTLAGQRPPKMDTPGTPGTPGKAPPPETVTIDAPTPLYAGEADAFAAAVRGDAPLPVTEADSLGNMRLLDRLRSQMSP